MKKILTIIIFLLSPNIVLGNTVKIYKCESIKKIELITVGIVTNYNNFKFKFKKTNQGLFFNSNSEFMRNFRMTVKSYDNGKESFSYFNDCKVFVYDKQIFNLSETGFDRINSITGQCVVSTE